MRVTCPHCRKEFNVTAEAAGRVATCNACKGRFTIPVPPAAIQGDSLEASPSSGKQHVITELTAKRYKFIQLCGTIVGVPFFLLFIAAVKLNTPEGGPLKFGAGGVIGLAGFLVGFGVSAVGRALAWWHHG